MYRSPYERELSLGGRNARESELEGKSRGLEIAIEVLEIADLGGEDGRLDAAINAGISD